MADTPGTRSHPPLKCPKCGDPHGFLSTRPEYDVTEDEIERLVWRCGTCGYPVITPTADETAVPRSET